MKAIIIGGGIGGLTTALMLHARGIDCEVFEQAETVRELGVGINTLPHAIKELAWLGLLERLDAIAVRTHELFYMNRFGQEDRRSGASRAGLMPATTCRSFRSTAAACRA
jgi:5-methylphenazine-1-carboxylate 1-monooxygenase